MARRSDPRQLSLDDWYIVPQPPAPTPGSLSISAELCAVLSDALAMARAERGLSREAIAARMSELAGETITKSMLDACTAESHERHRFPLQWAPAFEEATGTDVLQLLLARVRGTVLIREKGALHARLGKLRAQRAEIEAQRSQLAAEEKRLLSEIGDA